MAEIIFFAHDRTKPWDAEADARAYKRGDVISVCPDGWAWSQRELTNPDWRILRLTRITNLADLDPLLEPEWLGPQTLAVDTNGTLMRKRRRFVDPLKLPAAVQTWLADDTRAVPILESTVARAIVLNYITDKVKRQAGAIKAG